MEPGVLGRDVLGEEPDSSVLKEMMHVSQAALPATDFRRLLQARDEVRRLLEFKKNQQIEIAQHLFVLSGGTPAPPPVPPAPLPSLPSLPTAQSTSSTSSSLSTTAAAAAAAASAASSSAAAAAAAAAADKLKRKQSTDENPAPLKRANSVSDGGKVRPEKDKKMDKLVPGQKKERKNSKKAGEGGVVDAPDDNDDKPLRPAPAVPVLPAAPPHPFWVRVDAHFEFPTESNIATLHALIAECVPSKRHLAVPPLGKHYALAWSEADAMPGRKPGAPGEADTPALPGTIATRLFASLLGGGMQRALHGGIDGVPPPPPTLSSAQTPASLSGDTVVVGGGLSGKGGAAGEKERARVRALLAKRRNAAVEQELRMHLVALGILESEDVVEAKTSKNQSEEDEVLQDLRAAQAELVDKVDARRALMQSVLQSTLHVSQPSGSNSGVMAAIKELEAAQGVLDAQVQALYAKRMAVQRDQQLPSEKLLEAIRAALIKRNANLDKLNQAKQELKKALAK